MAVYSSGLNTTARMILLAISEFFPSGGGACYPSQVTIGDMVGCSDTTVRRNMKDIEKSGLLKIGKKKIAGNQHVTTYTPVMDNAVIQLYVASEREFKGNLLESTPCDMPPDKMSGVPDKMHGHPDKMHGHPDKMSDELYSPFALQKEKGEYNSTRACEAGQATSETSPPLPASLKPMAEPLAPEPQWDQSWDRGKLSTEWLSHAKTVYPDASDMAIRASYSAFVAHVVKTKRAHSMDWLSDFHAWLTNPKSQLARANKPAKGQKAKEETPVVLKTPEELKAEADAKRFEEVAKTYCEQTVDAVCMLKLPNINVFVKEHLKGLDEFAKTYVPEKVWLDSDPNKVVDWCWDQNKIKLANGEFASIVDFAKGLLEAYKDHLQII
ncbi:helix-turn-helix domain [Caudoviricetes sp.]|nr:helix-turn-helix domain [Caudoviricetes sp.]